MDINVTPAPCLGTNGWATDIAVKFDVLLAHFFLSDYNQSYIYRNNVTSLPRIIQQNGTNIQGVISDLKRKLTDYLGRYYDQINVEVSTDVDLYNPTVSRIPINLKIGVNDKGTQKTFGRIIDNSNGIMPKIIKLNN